MIELLPESEKNSVGFKVSGPVSYEDIKKLEPHLEKLIEQYGKINCLIVAEEGCPQYASWRAFCEDFMWAFKHLKQLNKIAVVGHSKILKAITTVDLIFGEKYFDLADLDKAWQYIKS
jgi:hypothetical protein